MKKGSGLLRAGLLVGGGAASGQALLFLTSLIVVRLFSPEHMGLFATYSSISACLVALFTGRFELAIPLPRHGRDAVSLARLAIGCSALLSTLSCLAFMVLADRLTYFELGHLSNLLWAIPALVMGTAFFQVASQVAVRTENYRAISTRAIMLPAITGLLQVVAGLMQLGAAGLVLSVCLGQLTVFFVVWIPASKKLRGGDPGPSTSAMKLVGAYNRFPLILAPAGLMNALASQLPQILVATFYGLAAAGQLGITMRIVALPVALIGQSLSYVYNGEIAKRARNSEPGILRAFDKLTIVLVGVSSVIAAGLFFLSPWIFPLILGNTWDTAGRFASILAVGVGMQLLVVPLSQTLTLAEWLGAQLAIDLLRGASIAGCFALALITNAPVDVALTYVTAGMSLSYVALWGINRLAARELDRKSGRTAVTSAADSQ